MITDCETETPGQFPQVVKVRAHTFRADVAADTGSDDSAPGPHDYFDAALAACKTLTATWYARKNGIALERVEAHVTSDATQERAGKYSLRVRMEYHGAISPEDKARLHNAVSRCPIHKLMTTSEITIETDQ